MTPLQVVVYARQRIPNERPPIEITNKDGVPLAGHLVWLGYYAACAMVSGALDDAETIDEMWEAVYHGQALHNSGVVAADDVHCAAGAVVLATMEWLDQNRPEVRRREREAERAGLGYDRWGMGKQSLN